MTVDLREIIERDNLWHLLTQPEDLPLYLDVGLQPRDFVNLEYREAYRAVLAAGAL